MKTETEALRSLHLVTIIVGYTALLITSGCAGNGEGLDVNGQPLQLPPNAPVAAFTVIQDTVFTPICSVCHGNPGAAGLNLTAGSSYAMLVGVPSAQVPALQRVKAGDPAASYLIQKLEGTQTAGQRMPRGGPFLSQETINFIRQWINDGAPRPTAIATASVKSLASYKLVDGLAVDVTSPVDGERVTAPLSQVVIGFDRPLDVTLVNESTVELGRVDATTTTGIAIRMSVPASNPSTLVVAPLVALTAGEYVLTLRGSGGGALAGLDAIPLSMVDPYHGGRNVHLTFAVETSQ